MSNESNVINFLTEMKALLEKYDACVYDYEQYKLCIDIGDVEVSWTWKGSYSESYLIPDNIFNFDKD